MKAFLIELRRRRVTRSAVVYAVIAWAVIEASSVIFPALHLPDWTVTFVVLLALIGFPVVLIFSWVFDVTRGGVVRTAQAPLKEDDKAHSLRPGRWVDFVIIAVLLVVIGWLGWERLSDAERQPVPGALDSIAVLPFANLTRDPADEYFSDGLAEELLNALVQVEGLRVAARTSSFQYKGQHLDVREIAESLGVATILEGSIRRAGGRIRITAQLVRADDGFHLWSETFDRELEDIFAVQDEIALAIVDALRFRLGTRERQRVTMRHTDDIKAFEAYLRGRFAMNQRSPDSLNRAVEEFRTAIHRDPDYATAYSGLSDTWLLLSDYGDIDKQEALQMAEPMARRALELAPELAEAHASWGLVLRNRDDIAGSVEPLRRATELNPSYSPAHHWLSLSYTALGQYDQAVETMRKGLEVDPEYVTGKRVMLGLLRISGRHEEADGLARELERDHRNNALVISSLTNDAMERGDLIRAVRLAAQAVELQPRAAHLRNMLASLLLVLNDVERADRQAEIARQHSPRASSVRLWPAQRALMVQDDAALERAIDEFLEETPQSRERDAQTCSLLMAGRLFERAMNHCRNAMDKLGWERGKALPPESLDVVPALIVVAGKTGDDELARELTALLEDEVQRLKATGLDPRQARFLAAMIRMHRGDPEPLLSDISELLVGRGFSGSELPRNPLFEPVHDDPRFIAEVKRLQEEAEAARQEIDRIEMPGE